MQRGMYCFRRRGMHARGHWGMHGSGRRGMHVKGRQARRQSWHVAGCLALPGWCESPVFDARLDGPGGSGPVVRSARQPALRCVPASACLDCTRSWSGSAARPSSPASCTCAHPHMAQQPLCPGRPGGNAAGGRRLLPRGGGTRRRAGAPRRARGAYRGLQAQAARGAAARGRRQAAQGVMPLACLRRGGCRRVASASW